MDSAPDHAPRDVPRLPAAGDRRGGDRRRHRDAALRVAHDRPGRGRARAPLRRVPRREARARGHLRHGGDAPRARRARRRSGDEWSRRRSRGPRPRTSSFTWAPRRCSPTSAPTTSTSTPSTPPRSWAGRTKAILPVHLAGQPADLDPLWALGIPVVECRARRRERLPGAEDRRPLRGDLLLALRDEERRRGRGGIGTNRDDVAEAVDDLRVMRRGHGSRYDIPVPGYKRTSPTCSPRSRSASSTRSSATGDPRQRRRLRRGDRGARRHRAARARPRDTHASPLHVVRIDPSAPGRRATATSRLSARSGSGRASTSCPCTG